MVPHWSPRLGTGEVLPIHWLPIVSSSIVIVAPADSIPGLRERLDSGAEIHVFADDDAIQALDYIFRHKPRLIAVEQEFSATWRGLALINRIKADPNLTECEVRVMARDSDLARSGPRRTAAATNGASIDTRTSLDQRGTRRVPRLRMGEGTAALVDGVQVTLVDLSVLGAQVVSPSVLRPNQRVRLALSDAHGIIRCQGSIAWASFEMPKHAPSCYRAGIEFKNADAEALSGYAERHKHR